MTHEESRVICEQTFLLYSDRLDYSFVSIEAIPSRNFAVMWEEKGTFSHFLGGLCSRNNCVAFYYTKIAKMLDKCGTCCFGSPSFL
jgi:hypothetical protein